MRTMSQLAVLALVGGLGAAWHLYGEQYGLPRPLALVGLEAAAPTAQQRGPAGGGGPVGVAVSAVRSGTVVDRAESVGTVRARDGVVITAKVTGIVNAIRFQARQAGGAGTAGGAPRPRRPGAAGGAARRRALRRPGRAAAGQRRRAGAAWHGGDDA